MIASQQVYLPMVQYLVTAGADINQATEGGFTPLRIARGRGHTEIARVLEEAGATLPEQNVNSE